MAARPITNVVIVLISADGTVSTIGPFISPQRANQWLTAHPQFSEANGFQTEIDRMTSPTDPEFAE